MASNIGLALLAAGGSSRMGSPKQLLLYRGRTLLKNAAETAVASLCQPVVVVLGGMADRLSDELTGLSLRYVTNENWEAGIGTSIRLGVRSLLDAEPNLEAVVILLADQPFAGPDAVTALVDRFMTNRPPVVASEYAGTVGVPALFSRELFPSLLAIADSMGAKSVILSAGTSAERIPLPVAEWDIDTPDDYSRLQNHVLLNPRMSR